MAIDRIGPARKVHIFFVDSRGTSLSMIPASYSLLANSETTASESSERANPLGRVRPFTKNAKLLITDTLELLLPPLWEWGFGCGATRVLTDRLSDVDIQRMAED